MTDDRSLSEYLGYRCRGGGRGHRLRRDRVRRRRGLGHLAGLRVRRPARRRRRSRALRVRRSSGIRWAIREIASKANGTIETASSNHGHNSDRSTRGMTTQHIDTEHGMRRPRGEHRNGARRLHAGERSRESAPIGASSAPCWAWSRSSLALVQGHPLHGRVRPARHRPRRGQQPDAAAARVAGTRRTRRHDQDAVPQRRAWCASAASRCSRSASALLVRPDGLGVFAGLAVFQVLMLVGAAVPVFRSLRPNS